MDRRLTLVEHLTELRQRIIVCVVTVIITAAIAYFFAQELLLFLAKPVDKLVFIAPTELFFTHIKLALLAGLFLSLPVIFYQIWRFVSIALKKEERKYALAYGPLSFLFFLIGAAFAYWVVVPVGLKFLLGFAAGDIRPMISVKNYISFLVMLLLVFGVVFELPLATMFLTKLGLITPKFLTSKRKPALVLIFIVAAVVTPPDLFTQILMVGPLLLLYEMSIWFSKLISTQKVEA